MSTGHHRSSVIPVDPAVPGVQDPADRVVPADRVDQVVLVSRADQAMGMAATGREVTSPEVPEDTNQVAREDTGQGTRVDLADLADLVLVDLAIPGGAIPGGPEATTRVDLGDMIRERPGVPSLAVRCLVDLATPGDTIPAGRAVLGRMPVRRPPTAELPLRTRALLHPTPAERRTPADRRWEPILQAEVAATRREALTWAAATRPADRTLRLEAIRPVGATPERK